MSAPREKGAPPLALAGHTFRRDIPGFRCAQSGLRLTTCGARSEVAQDLLQALRGHWQLRYRARHSNGIVDGGGNRRADAGDAALAGPFDAEGIERAGIVLAQHDIDLGDLV